MIRVALCLKCKCGVLDPQGPTCPCGGTLSSVIKEIAPHTRVGSTRPAGAYWVRGGGLVVELMEWWPEQTNGVPHPGGQWVSFAGPDYGENDSDVDVVAEGPIKPPQLPVRYRVLPPHACVGSNGFCHTCGGVIPEKS